MTEDSRQKRVANASGFWARIEGFTQVEPDARINAVYNELMFSISRILDDNKGHRFKDPEINVLRDVAFQIVYLVDASNRPRTNFLQRLFNEFRSLSAMQKVAALAATAAFIVTAMLGSIDLYKKQIEPFFQSIRETPSTETTPSQEKR